MESLKERKGENTFRGETTTLTQNSTSIYAPRRQQHQERAISFQTTAFPLGNHVLSLGPAAFQENSLSGVLMLPNKGNPTLGARSILSKKKQFFLCALLLGPDFTCIPWTRTPYPQQPHTHNSRKQKDDSEFFHLPTCGGDRSLSGNVHCPDPLQLKVSLLLAANHPKLPASSAARRGPTTYSSPTKWNQV